MATVDIFDESHVHAFEKYLVCKDGETLLGVNILQSKNHSGTLPNQPNFQVNRTRTLYSCTTLKITKCTAAKLIS